MVNVLRSHSQHVQKYFPQEHCLHTVSLSTAVQNVRSGCRNLSHDDGTHITSTSQNYDVCTHCTKPIREMQSLMATWWQL